MYFANLYGQLETSDADSYTNSSVTLTQFWFLPLQRKNVADRMFDVRGSLAGICLRAISELIRRLVMKWAGMYLVGFVVLIGGVLAALWKLGVLESIGTAWTLIGVVILVGFGIMISVSQSGTKENIEIDRK